MSTGPRFAPSTLPAVAAKGRTSVLRSKGRSSKSLVVRAGADYEALRGQMVVNVATGEFVEVTSLWEARPGKCVVLPFMTHFADLSSWEYAQKLVKVMPQLEASGAQVIAVGLGSEQNARGFANTLNFPLEKLYADPSGACYQALGFTPGFGEGSDLNPYMKLVPMLMGIGSPGKEGHPVGCCQASSVVLALLWSCCHPKAQKCKIDEGL